MNAGSLLTVFGLLGEAYDFRAQHLVLPESGAWSYPITGPSWFSVSV